MCVAFIFERCFEEQSAVKRSFDRASSLSFGRVGRSFSELVSSNRRMTFRFFRSVFKKNVLVASNQQVFDAHLDEITTGMDFYMTGHPKL